MSKMEVSSVLVTGANRGIGIELVRQLVQLPKPPRYVFATYRNKDTAQALKAIIDSSKECQVHGIQMDIGKPEEVEAARKIIEGIVGDKGLNLLINNAGALKKETVPDIVSDENMLFHFATNTLGPIAVLKEMLPLLQKAAALQSTGLSVSRATVLNISSTCGSLALLDDNIPRQFVLPILSYRVSKAALNMAMRAIALELKDKGILVVQMCPGWVKTDMGTEMADLEVSESVSAILKTCSMLNEAHQGCFVDRNGKSIPF